MRHGAACAAIMPACTCATGRDLLAALRAGPTVLTAVATGDGCQRPLAAVSAHCEDAPLRRSVDTAARLPRARFRASGQHTRRAPPLSRLFPRAGLAEFVRQCWSIRIPPSE